MKKHAMLCGLAGLLLACQTNMTGMPPGTSPTAPPHLSLPDYMPPEKPRVCSLERIAADETDPGVTLAKYTKAAVSTAGNFMVNFYNQKRVYSPAGVPFTGSAFDPGDPISPDATAPWGPVEALFGTTIGFVASVWDYDNGTMGTRNRLVRLDNTGAITASAKTYVNINGAAARGTMAMDGDWVASSAWLPGVRAYYNIGQVNNQAEIVDATTRDYNFEVPDASCNIMGGMAKSGDTVALGVTWFDLVAKNANVGVYLKNPGKSPIWAKLAPPTGTINDMTGCYDYYQVNKVLVVGEQFLVFWQKTGQPKKYVSFVSADGQVVTTMSTLYDAFITDIAAIKGGYALAVYDQFTPAVGLVILDESFNHKYSKHLPVGLRPLPALEQPVLATTGMNGHFALAWVDGEAIGRVAFFATTCE